MEHPDRQSDVLARVLALVEPAPAEEAELDGDGAHLNRVCQAAVSGLGMSGAAVTLRSVNGSEAIVAAVDGDGRASAELEFGLGEGPTGDAFRLGHPVLAPDLGDPRESRWVSFAAASVEAGVSAIFAFPLAFGAARFGVLTMFKESPGRLDRQTTDVCLALAEAATHGLLNSVDGRHTGSIDPELTDQLEFRTEIHQAQGMLMVALRTDLTDALARMRAHAYATERPLLEVATDILDGRSALTEPRTEP